LLDPFDVAFPKVTGVVVEPGKKHRPGVAQDGVFAELHDGLDKCDSDAIEEVSVSS
jgi:hypothetical protein